VFLSNTWYNTVKLRSIISTFRQSRSRDVSVILCRTWKPISLRNRYFKISPGKVGRFKFSLVVVRVIHKKEKINNVTWGLNRDIYLTDWLRSWWLHASRVQRSRCCQELEGTFVRFHFKIVALLTKNPKNLSRGDRASRLSERESSQVEEISGVREQRLQDRISRARLRGC
jgi:hypothetical protein